MKKRVLICFSLLAFTFANAQSIDDAVRYSIDDVQGTARYRALSGAFGALGGDMSAVSINPAGSSVFNNSNFSLSLNNRNASNKTEYFGNSFKNTESIVDLNQAGAAFVFNTPGSSNWKKFTLGIAYDKVADYETDWYASGTNTNNNPNLSNSVASYFLAYANGLRLDEISRFPGESYSDAYGDIGSAYGYANQQAFLGFESFILEPEDIENDANTSYFANIGEGNFNHEYNYIASGFNGKFTMNASAQYGDNLFFGINLNSHFINYERYTYLYESNNNVDSIINEVGFENALTTRGSGFSLQLGAIWKLNNDLRFGFTYNTPTWFNIEEENTQYIGTYSYDFPIYNTNIDPRVINVFPSYRLRTPGKLTGSIAYVFGTNGLISLDYGIKDYRNAKFRPTNNAHFSNENNTINNLLTTASTIKVGGEYKIYRLSLRGGYRFEESPYKNEKTIGDLSGYSLGLGYSFGNFKLDLTFDTSKQEFNQGFYNVGFVETVHVNNKNYNVTTSVSFSL